MKLIDIYRLAVEIGRKADPRTADEIDRELDEAKKQFEKLDDREKELFDQDRLWNPYADSRLSYGADADVNGLMVGIDISTGEVLLADRLREKGDKVDAICAHHPMGQARVKFPDVMYMQEKMLSSAGVPVTVAEGLMRPRVEEVKRRVMPSNYNQEVDACKLLDMPIMNCHSPADNMVQSYLQNRIDETQPYKCKDILDMLYEIPEYRMAAKGNAEPCMVVGSKDNKVGKALVKMSGGTSGPKTIYERMSQAGVGTVVYMHAPEDHIDEAKKYHINIVIAGHMASDSLGLNMIMDKVEEKGVEIVPCSGFLRVKRN
jgi:hypothetical protein